MRYVKNNFHGMFRAGCQKKKWERRWATRSWSEECVWRLKESLSRVQGSTTIGPTMSRRLHMVWRLMEGQTLLAELMHLDKKQILVTGGGVKNYSVFDDWGRSSVSDFFTFYTWFLTSSVIFLNLFWSFIYFSTISHLICIFLSLIMSIVLCEMALYPYVELTLPSLNSSLVCCWKQKIRKYWKPAFSEGSESSKFELSGSIHCLWLK